MGTQERLRVRVNDELVLDAGTCKEVSGSHGPLRLVSPPETTLFQQVLAYLEAKPDPPKRPGGGAESSELVLRRACVAGGHRDRRRSLALRRHTEHAVEPSLQS